MPALALSRWAVVQRRLSPEHWRSQEVFYKTKTIFLRLACASALATVSLSASQITFSTASGASTGGGPVSASAQVTTGANSVTVTLTDLLANPTDVAQLISDFSFTLS